MVTAKIKCIGKQVQGEGDDRQVVTTFAPDYADERNKEWARWTPALSLSMTLRGTVADQFELEQAYTLTFEASE